MLTHVHIQNFRSFVDAETPLRPFTLVLGANGSGKSNFLKFFQMSTLERLTFTQWEKHLCHLDDEAGATLQFVDHTERCYFIPAKKGASSTISGVPSLPWEGRIVWVYNPDPAKIATAEAPATSPVVNGDGSGTCQVLDSLKTGDREDLFDKIEAAFKTYVPEVEKLSLKTVGAAKQIQVRERGLDQPLPATELSEGTRLILCLLTILHQENPPPLILLEDIDRGLHPRLFEYVAPLIRRLAVDHGINVIATTHNPYLVDYFRDDKEAVVLVEKANGESKLIPLTDRLKETSYTDADADDLPLGQLWFSGLIGGGPAAIHPVPAA